MGITLLDTDFSDFIVPVTGMETPLAPGTGQARLAIPKGDIHFKETSVRDQLSIVEASYVLQDDVRIIGKGQNDLLEIQFNLSDRDLYYLDKSKTEHVTLARSGNIAFLAADENEAKIHFQKDVVYQTFDIHLPLSFLEQYAGESRSLDSFLEDIRRGRSSKFSKDKIGISSKMYHTIQEIRDCTYEGLTKRIYLESKAYELVALLYEQRLSQPAIRTLSTADQERIRMAGAMIRENLERPYTIFQLARMVGINQTKLKIGFKEVFGQTVFGYLQEIRMNQAKRYLLDTGLSVQEIGLLLGYQNTSNFSIAFKKTFGYSPMKLRER